MRTHLFQLALAAATMLAASTADAKPRRVVVLEFDGPRQLADTGRSAVMSVLGEQYNIVATKTWDSALARSPGRGPGHWRQASKQAGVDAVIEGWVQTEGRHSVMTIAVRDAASGNEVDTFSIRIKDRGVTTDATHKIAAQLDELLGWIDGDITAEPTTSLPDVRTLRPMLGARDPNRDRDRTAARDDDDDEEDDDATDRRRSKRSRKSRDDGRARDDDRREARDDDRDERDDRDDDRRDDRETKRAKKKKVAVADDDTSDLVTLFGPESKEAAIVSEGRTAHVPQPTPRFQISAGGYVSSRGMGFTYDPESKDAPPEYPASSIKGFAAQVAVYPLPTKKIDGRLSGLGFTLDLAHSVGAILPAKDDTGYGDYTLVNTSWETGIHYRWPIDIVSIDVSANFGNNTYALGSDFPGSVAIPDASYSYLGAGGHLDLNVTDHATVGAGARYMYLLGAGMVTEQDWYGAGTASGVALDGNFVIPLPYRLYVKGGIEYRRVKIDFEGSGDLSQMWGVWDVTDSSIAGTGTLGVQF